MLQLSRDLIYVPDAPHINLSGILFLSPFPYVSPLQVFLHLFFTFFFFLSYIFTILDVLPKIHAHRL